MQHAVGLTDLDVEILEYLSMSPESTTMLDQEMLNDSPGRPALQQQLIDLAGRGLVVAERAVGSGPLRNGERVYEDDYWTITSQGRGSVVRSKDG